MSHSASMTANFETEKNIKATAYTSAICILLVIVFFFLQWTLPQIPAPLLDEGIEVNLGNSETGLGDIAPLTPGTPSSANQTNVSPPASAKVVKQEQNIKTDDNNDPDAPAINKPAKPIVKTTPVTHDATPAKKPAPVVTNPTPKPQVAKALMQKVTTTGNGGNNPDDFNKVRNQGIAGGKGDQGNPNGDPNSKSYTGNSPSGNGVSIRSGLNGRNITNHLSFEDDFNEPAKVAVDITVDREGNVTDAVVNPRGTTTTNQNIRGIAVKKAKQLKLNAGKEDEQTGTIVFDFKLKG